MTTKLARADTMAAAVNDSAVGVDEVVSRDRARARVEAEVAAAAGILNAAHGRLVRAVADAIATASWRGYGIRSVEHWLTLQVGVSRAHAAQLVRLASRAGELPRTVESLAAGTMTLDQASVVAATVPAGYDGQVAALAAGATVPQLGSLLRRYQFIPVQDAAPKETTAGAAEDDDATADTATSSEADIAANCQSSPAATADAAAWCRAGWTDTGRYRLVYDAPADAGALVDHALKEAKDRLFQLATGTNTVITTADAFTAMATSGLEQLTQRGLASRVDKYRVYLHLDLDRAWVNAGPALPSTLRDKLLCDCVVRPLWHSEGKPVNVGRAQRIVPVRTRRLVEDRDRVCRFPGCTATGYLEVHHKMAWSRGGATDLINLMCLCPAHHDAVHRGEYVIDGDPDAPAGDRRRLIFTDAAGHRIGLPPPTVPPSPLPAPQRAYRKPYGERLNPRDIWLQPAPTPPSRN